jgi:hypothetical protein
MVKRVSLVRLRADMPLEQAQQFWIDQHATRVSTLAEQGLRRYVVNLVDPAASEEARHPLTPAGDRHILGCDGFAETWFDSVEAMNGIINGNQPVTRGDDPDFIEAVRVLVVREHRVI